jgi:hypothetical protein
MSEAVKKNNRSAGDSAVVPRLFVLELNAGRIHSMNTDGSDRKTIVTDCRLPDGIAVDVDQYGCPRPERRVHTPLRTCPAQIFSRACLAPPLVRGPAVANQRAAGRWPLVDTSASGAG